MLDGREIKALYVNQAMMNRPYSHKHRHLTSPLCILHITGMGDGERELILLSELVRMHCMQISGVCQGKLRGWGSLES